MNCAWRTSAPATLVTISRSRFNVTPGMRAALIRGMHGITSTLASAAEDVVEALDERQTVLYTIGGDFAAALFVVVHTDDPDRPTGVAVPQDGRPVLLYALPARPLGAPRSAGFDRRGLPGPGAPHCPPPVPLLPMCSPSPRRISSRGACSMASVTGPRTARSARSRTPTGSVRRPERAWLTSSRWRGTSRSRGTRST